MKPKPKVDPVAMLADLVEFNADRIVEKEGKPRSEAVHLAICLVCDDLMARKAGGNAHDAVMVMLHERYPDHANDVITYIVWSTGKIKLKPEFEAQFLARHA